MKFTRVVLENIFAYEQSAVFDFSGTTEDRNIVLVWGRNGMGKTSFLNAMKLLFTGIEDPEYRRVGFPPTVVGARAYVLGDGSHWAGIVNRAARRRANLVGQPVEARVEVSWEDGEREKYTAVRSWTVRGDNYTADVYINRGESRLAGKAAEEQLATILPPGIVRFFFFDGEDIKSIAETVGSHQKEVDQLLQITFVESLSVELEKIAGERRRRGMEVELRRQVDKARSDLARAETTESEAKERLSELQEQLNTDGIELRRLQLRRENLSSGASASQRSALEAQRTKLTADVAKTTDELVSLLPITVPVLGNLGLVATALDQIELRLKNAGSAEAHLVKGVISLLPEWIGDAPVPLDQEAIGILAAHLAVRLEAKLSGSQGAGLFSTADVSRMERLREALQNWSIAGPDRRELQARLLVMLQAFKRELRDTEEALLHIEVGSQSNLEEFRQVASRIGELEDRTSEHNQQKGQWTVRLNEAVKLQKTLAVEIVRLEASQDNASLDSADARFIAKVVRALNEISEAMRRATREDLEALLNEHFKKVIDHPLIARITLDDVYTLTYLDASGKTIGRTSISSGMKQLVATAFLWAMKDSAGVDMPVIIDTPLGRIDRENQDHMLLNYYPKLSKQVIILPTNAEIDGRKLNLIEPYVACHYKILNETGEGAVIKTGALVELA